ncbi:MAG: ABC transporter permease [bacterium]
MSRILRIAREAMCTVAGNRIRFLMMVTAIFIGVTSLTMVICFTEGTRQHVMELVARHGLDTLMIRPGSGKDSTDARGLDRSIVSLSKDDALAIETSVPNVLRVAPIQNQRGVDMKYGEKSTTAEVFGVTPDWAVVRDFGPSEGMFISEDDMMQYGRVCLLGRTVKRTLFGDVDPIGRTVQIRNIPFIVKGVLIEKGVSASGKDRDDRIVIPLSTASKRLFAQDYLNQIVVQVRDVRTIHETAKEIEALLRQKHGLGPDDVADFSIREPTELADMASGTSATLASLLLAMAGISMLVGGIVIMNVMLISISERRTEIGLRRAMGARKPDIMVQILIECLSVTMAGGILGVLFGAGITTYLSFAGIMASRVGWLPFAISVLSCTVIAVVFGTYPAKKAAAIDPTAAMRS